MSGRGRGPEAQVDGPANVTGARLTGMGPGAWDREMTEFLALLLAYYTCDAAAQTQEPLGGDRLACMATYEEVKG